MNTAADPDTLFEWSNRDAYPERYVPGRKQIPVEYKRADSEEWRTWPIYDN